MILFNAITVDGDTSTNDAFLAFSSGPRLQAQNFDFLKTGLKCVAEYLAKSIARDGEGSNCLIEVKVEGADTASSAKKNSSNYL